ncbi:unnamed protein product [Diamesa tonsa]
MFVVVLQKREEKKFLNLLSVTEKKAQAQHNGNGFGSVSKSNDAVYGTGSYGTSNRNYGKGSVGVSNSTNGTSTNQVAFSNATQIIKNINLFQFICAIMLIKFYRIMP